MEWAASALAFQDIKRNTPLPKENQRNILLPFQKVKVHRFQQAFITAIRDGNNKKILFPGKVLFSDTIIISHH